MIRCGNLMSATTKMTGAKILIVQDNHLKTVDLKNRLLDLGHEVCGVATSVPRAVKKAAEARPDLALVDLSLESEANDINVAEAIGAQINIPLLCLIDRASETQLQQAMKSDSFDYILEPLENLQLRLDIQSILARYRKECEQRQTVETLGERVALLVDRVSFLENILENVSDGIVVSDTDGAFLYINKKAGKIVGMRPTGDTPDRWAEAYGAFYPDGKTVFPSDLLPLTRAIRGEATEGVEMIMRNKKRPAGIYISVDGKPLLDSLGILRGGVIVIRDITKLRESQSELKIAEEVLVRESLEREFIRGRLQSLDSILHNIGNAINSVTIGIGTIVQQIDQNVTVRRISALAKAIEAHREDWISYLTKDPKGKQVLPFILTLARDLDANETQMKGTIARVDKSAQHIADIIKAQSSHQRHGISRRHINVLESISDAIKFLQHSIRRTNIQIEIDGQNAPEEIWIEVGMFHQMIVNLVKNSIESIHVRVQGQRVGSDSFTHVQGLIRIHIYVDENFLVLDVIDNGIGVGQDALELVFRSSYTTKSGGGGLGLYSAAEFVRKLRGDISLLSDGIGTGATVRVRLDLSSISSIRDRV